MEPTYTDVVLKNVLFAMEKADVKRGALADALGISGVTVAKRLKDGKFTIPQLCIIADAAGTTIAELLPVQVAA